MTEKEFLIWLANEGEGARVSFYDSDGDFCEYRYSKGKFWEIGQVNSHLQLEDILLHLDAEHNFKVLPPLFTKQAKGYFVPMGEGDKPHYDLYSELGIKAFATDNGDDTVFIERGAKPCTITLEETVEK